MKLWVLFFRRNCLFVLFQLFTFECLRLKHQDCEDPVRKSCPPRVSQDVCCNMGALSNASLRLFPFLQAPLIHGRQQRWPNSQAWPGKAEPCPRTALLALLLSAKNTANISKLNENTLVNQAVADNQHNQATPTNWNIHSLQSPSQ